MHTALHPVIITNVCAAGTCAHNHRVGTKVHGSSRAGSSLLLSADKSELALVKVFQANSVTIAKTTPEKAVEVTSATMSRADLLELVESQEFQIHSNDIAYKRAL